MKVAQDKVFQPITITIETLDELKLITAALNSSHISLKEQWENMGYQGSINTDIIFGMWNQVTRLLEDNQ